MKQTHQCEIIIIAVYNNYYYDSVQSIFKTNVLDLG